MLQAGQRIDRYVVDRLLGRGGFAEVWAVDHAVLGTPRAIKVLLTDQVLLQEGLVEEGRVQARLTHPNILPVLDMFVHQDAPVLVMPLVEEATLHDVLDDGALDAPTAAAVLRGVLDAIAFAHREGVAHRDLKPANVLLELRNGAVVPRVADFGLAKLLTGPGVFTTGAGPFVGTPAYAAPEQIKNARGVDHRADYWSLGVILYELLTGWRPFDMTSLQDLYRRQSQRRYAPLRERERTVDPRWEGLVDQLLDPDPEQRMSDPAQVRAELDRLAPHTIPGPLDADGRLAGKLWARRGALRRATLPTEDLTGDPLDNLPRFDDAFIGREAEVGELQSALRRPGLVTLTGPAGVGKSRLALEVVHARMPSSDGHTRRVDLADARTIDDVLAAVAQALDVPVVVDDPLAHLAWVVEARSPLLLLLDNADSVLEPIQRLILSITTDDAELRVMVTSRQPLHMPGETVIRLDVLPVPTNDTQAAVQKSDAVKLFMTRVRERRPGVAVNAQNAAALANLVRRLDGLPLALELAAARPSANSVGPVDLSGMLRQLAGELDVLGLDSRSDHDEPTTLRAALDGSWAMLDRAERHLLACMSAFEGGATLAAIRTVAGTSDRRATEDRLASLVDRSLVRRTQGPGRSPRFALLRSVHAYGLERLAELPPAVVDAIYRGHARFFARFGHPHELAALRVRGGTARRVELQVELANLLVALTRAIAWRDTDTVAALALAAWAVTEHQGPYPAAVRWLREARRAGVGPRDPDLCLAEGDALRLSGRRDASNRAYKEGLRKAHAQDDPWATGMCLDRLGRNNMAQGRLDQADPLLREALSEIVTSGDPSRIAEVTDDIGWLRLQQGRAVEAEQLFADALARFERLGDRGAEGVATQHLALAALANGDLARADELLQVALGIHRSTGHTRMEAFCLSDLGEVARREERWDDVTSLQRRSASLQRDVGDRHGEALAMFRLGMANKVQNHVDARATLETAWELANSAGDGPLEQAIEEALRGT